MSHFTLAASGLIIDAFQWQGGNLEAYALPCWAQNMQFTTPGNNTICVPCYNGIQSVNPTDWVAQGPGGNVFTMANTMFAALFTATL
jgi:hypothetical protein